MHAMCEMRGVVKPFINDVMSCNVPQCTLHVNHVMCARFRFKYKECAIETPQANHPRAIPGMDEQNH